MKTKSNSFSKTATGAVATVGSVAHQAIGVYRESGERLLDAMDQRWKKAFKESSPQLSAETRKNAQHAHDVFQGYYAKGLAMSADGAEVVVDTVIGAVIAGVERAASFQHAYTQKSA
ncbi:MAG TPA: hypothetical protein VK996_04065 [Ramlibacter sp.]|nr:hypothetical protein [Ramlibacter sp.]